MRSRRRRAAAIAWLLAAGVARGASPADAQSIAGLSDARFVEQRERFTPGDGAPVELRFLITPEAAAQTARVVSATRMALTMLSAWFGPMPGASLTVAGVGWRPGHVPTSAPGMVAVPLRWLAPVRDQATERALLDGVVRQYWIGAAVPAGNFAQALVAYISARAIHHQLEGSNFATLRFFGGFVPLSLRSVLLSPPVADPRPRAWRFDEPGSEGDAELRAAVRALQTLERYVGWPTMLAAVSSLRTAAAAPDADGLAAALSEVRGTDLRFLVNECFRADAVFDYAVADLQSRAGSAGLTETTLTIVRQGTGVFATRTGSVDRTPIMPLRVRFADGSELRDVFDGAAPSASPVYSATTAGVSATVDPDVMLLLDVNRENNAIVRDARIARRGIRLALNWMAWLQNTMLSYTAIL